MLENYTLQDFQEISAIEKLYYPGLESSPDYFMQFWKKNNHIIASIRDTDQHIGGFLTAIPVTDELYTQFLGGQFDDTQLVLNDVLTYSPGGIYNLYFCSVALRPDFRTDKANLKQLGNACIDRLIDLNQNHDIQFKCVFGDAVTDAGKRFATTYLGLAPLTKTPRGSVIMGRKISNGQCAAYLTELKMRFNGSYLSIHSRKTNNQR